MNKEKIVKTLKTIGVIILTYFGIFLLNNLRNILNIILNNRKNLVYISIPIVISLLIFLFYIYKIKKKNKYKNIILILMLIFYNVCNGVLYSSNLNTFFILYLIILLFSFRLYISNENFSLSLIASFSIMILVTMILGMVGLLKIVKYVFAIYIIYSLIHLHCNKEKLNINAKMNSFINKELLIFTILYIVAIIGGVGRFIHTYDEYSHWAYDAKAVIYYNKLSTSKEIMSQTRSYAPILTCWHYIVAQFSNFSEQNLYIGLSIFISVFLMSVIAINKNNSYSYIAILLAYASCFILGGVYSFNNLYADLAFGVVFGATLISYLKYKENDSNQYIFIILLIMLTLIKPSGCTASFSVLFYIALTNIIENNGTISKKIKEFIKEYWKIIITVILSFLIWNIYVKICNLNNNVFYDVDIRPWTLRTDIIPKLNYNYILSFLTKIIASLDDTLIYNSINMTTYQFLVVTLSFIITIIFITKEKINKFLCSIISYIVFFCLTALSIFVSFSYYETSIIASFGRYLNCIHIAIILSIIYVTLKNIDKKTMKVMGILLLFFILSNSSFKNLSYFITDINERKETHQIYNERNDKFSEVIKNTKSNSKVFVIDQKDEDGIMAMWYARYYLFPRKVNASSNAITWKIKTSKNAYDLQNWGLTDAKFKDLLLNYKFDYVYFYTNDEELANKLNINLSNNLYKHDEKGILKEVEENK